MKTASFLGAFICIAILASALAAMAQPAAEQDYPATMAQSVFSGNVLTTLTTTNGNNTNGAAYPCMVSKNHTFQIVTLNSTGTNCSTFLDRSLDATNWICFYTNTVSANSTNDTTLVGRWAYFRGRFTGTNASAQVNYMGGN